MNLLRSLYRRALLELLERRLAARHCTTDALSLFLSQRIDRLDAAAPERKRDVFAAAPRGRITTSEHASL